MDTGRTDILSRHQVPRHRLTLNEYHRLGEAGILGEDDRVELLEGQLVDMSPIAPRHALAVDALNELLVIAVAGRAGVRVHSGGAPGAKTPVHSHPGAKAFYVLSGRMGQKTPHGVSYAEAGESMNGHGGDMPMEVFSAGTTDLDQLVMFVVDATKPFPSPAKFE